MRARWLLLAGFVVLIVFAVSLLPPCAMPLLAQSGCCRTRTNLSAPWAKRFDLNFAGCRNLNQQLDRGDNIFEPRGRVWWDQRCG